MNKTERITIRLPFDQHRWLMWRSVELDDSIAKVIRRLIQEQINKEARNEK